jgi:hypothetical protein
MAKLSCTTLTIQYLKGKGYLLTKPLRYRKISYSIPQPLQYNKTFYSTIRHYNTKYHYQVQKFLFKLSAGWWRED